MIDNRMFVLYHPLSNRAVTREMIGFMRLIHVPFITYEHLILLTV